MQYPPTSYGDSPLCNSNIFSYLCEVMATRDNKTKDKIIAPQEGFQEKFVESNIDVVFGGGAAGVGKSVSVNELVLSEEGFIPISSLKIGSKILDVHGNIQTVLGIYPQGKKELYRFTFENGATAEACAEHLWEVKYANRGIKPHWSIMDSTQIKTALMFSEEAEIAIPTYLHYRKKANKILSVERTNRLEECVCIKVSSKEGLFVIKDYVVTHNTSAAVLAIAYYVGNPNYRALYVRKNLGELKGGGSMPEEFAKLYPEPLIARTTMSDNPEIEFVSGCKVVMTHMANENIHDITERVKGWQYDFIYMDELTAYQWNTFAYLMSRNRGSSGEKPLFRGTTNPKRNSWVRKFIDWYVDEDGFIDPLRDGVVRYFYYAGGTVEDVIWGDTPEEVYMRCKERIDRQMKASKTEHLSPYDLIKSFTFYSGKLGDNKILLKDQPQYVGNLAMAGGTQAAQLLEGNWNVDMEEDSESLIYPQHMDNLFDNDYQITEKKYITVDIALQGDDNLVAMVWYGFHIKDIVVLSGTITPPEAINAVQLLQQKHDIGNYNIIYDSIGVGSFFSGFFSGAVAFNSNFTPSKAGKARFSTLKAECAHKLSEMLDARAISIEKNLLDRIYKHKNAKESRTIRQELIRESKVLIPKVSNNGKIGLITKKEMGAMLGKGNSPDLLDPMILRMYPDLDYVPNGIVPTGDTYMQGKDDIHIDLEDFFNNEW